MRSHILRIQYQATKQIAGVGRLHNKEHGGLPGEIQELGWARRICTPIGVPSINDQTGLRLIFLRLSHRIECLRLLSR